MLELLTVVLVGAVAAAQDEGWHLQLYSHYIVIIYHLSFTYHLLCNYQIRFSSKDHFPNSKNSKKQVELDPAQNTDWRAVQRGVFISYDMEHSPLQIKTDSIVGSNEQVKVYFHTAGRGGAGKVSLLLTSPPQYRLSPCNTSLTNFSTVLPLETDKLWTISLKRTSGKKRVSITCNSKEVLDLVLSNTTCIESTWSYYWSRDVSKIYFSLTDTASDFYRPGKHVKVLTPKKHQANLSILEWRKNGFLVVIGFFCLYIWLFNFLYFCILDLTT